MKVALIGNMNNNNFSIMRYFRDLGVDAHLILFKNDVTKSQTHFKPEFDTWEIEKWNPYIHYINFTSHYAALFYPAFLLKKYFIGYDILISCGHSPVILNKCGIKIDIYYPTGVGIEGVGDKASREGLKHLTFIKRFMSSKLRKLKISAIRKAKICLNSELSLTKQTFDELNIPFQKISIPMVYNREKSTSSSEKLIKIKQKINSYKYKFICHVSHLPTKNKLPMLEGFAKFAFSQKENDCLLILFEYGTHSQIELTKQRIKKLGVENRVLWLSKKTRK